MRAWIVRTPICAFLQLAAAAPLSTLAAQTRPEQAFFDSLLVTLHNTTSVAALPVARCATQSREIARTCEALIAGRRAEITRTRDDARLAEVGLERGVVDQAKSPFAWYGLGLIRLQLARDTLFSRGGALMPVGTSYLRGASNAFVEALNRDLTFALAAESLVTLPIPREGISTLKDRVAILRRSRYSLPLSALPAAAALERIAGSVDSAIALEERALASGSVDIGLISLGLARDLYRIGRPVQGRKTLLDGSGNPTTETRNAYRTELAWVASPDELVAWDSLKADDRPRWLADFWQKRDIAEGRKDGARLIEHYKRIEYAMTNFRQLRPETGRQRLLTQTASGLDAEAAARKLAMTHPDCFPDAARLANDDLVIGAHAPMAYYQPIQDQVDDRGVIWIRHGPPSVRRVNMRLEAAEVWRYDLSPVPLIVQFREIDFDGTVGAATLTPTLLSLSPIVRANLCEADRALCRGDERELELTAGTSRPTKPLGCSTMFIGREAALVTVASAINAEAKDPFVGNNSIAQARQDGRAQIDRATTTDSYHRDFSHAIVPGVQILGLSRADGNGSRIVVAFALLRADLAPDKAGLPANYPVAIQVMASDASGRRVDIDTVRNFTTTDVASRNQYFTGIVEIPMPPATYHVSLVVSQTNGRLGLAHLSEIRVPGNPQTLSVSDLVFGRDDENVHWNSGATSVPLNPLNTYPAGGSAEVYFQLSGLTIGAAYQTRFEFFRADDDPKKPPRLSVSASQPAVHERQEVSRTLGLQQLEPGKYRVRLTVTGGGAETSATAWLTVVK